eukprot:6189121-Pleurochrysis_carterae.AAC.1
MSSPSPTASPRMPASRAQYACQACRMSKVRCDLQCLGGGKCSRCARLALRCAPAVSKRGRANPARDIARLGPAVRALLVKNEEFLVKEEHGHDPAPVRSTDLFQYSADGPSLSMTEHSKEYDSQPLVWYGTSCPRMIVSSIDSREGKVALLKHWLRIALRSRSCGKWQSQPSPPPRVPWPRCSPITFVHALLSCICLACMPTPENVCHLVKPGMTRVPRHLGNARVRYSLTQHGSAL